MMKKLISILLIVMMLLSMTTGLFVAGATEELFAGGSGTEADPYLIADKYHLQNVRYHTDAHFKMTANVVFSEEDFLAGGAFYNAGNYFDPIPSLAGTFDGGGFAIKNLKINYKGEGYYSALFQNLSSTGVIKNLKIEGGSITGEVATVGAIVGSNGGLVENCENSATIGAGTITTRSMRRAGGIVGDNSYNGIIKNCTNSGDIIASCTDPATSYTGYTRESYAGGITAENENEIINCRNTGKVYAEVIYGYGSAVAVVGGIVGVESSSGGEITNCSNSGEISGRVNGGYHTPYTYAGGIVGLNANNSKLTDCHNTGSVHLLKGGECYAGGIFGKNQSNNSVKKCYNLGEISSEYEVSKAYVGGLAGHNNSNATLRDCYNVGTVSGKAHSFCYTGGLAGYCTGKLIYCYNNGDVCGETESEQVSRAYVGGLAGVFAAQYVPTLNCYNTGAISGAATTEAFIGGIGGYFAYTSSGNAPNTHYTYLSYSAGTVSRSRPAKGNTYLGAIAGKCHEQMYGPDNVFYYLPCGASDCGSGAVYNAYSRSTYQLSNSAYLSYMNFTTDWFYDRSFGYNYPQLQSNPQYKPVRLILLSPPALIEFTEGKMPDLTGLQIRVIYENTLESVVDVTASMLPDLNLRTVGRQEVKVKYGDVYSDTALKFECLPSEITAIKVVTPPDVILYHQDEKISLGGLQVVATYSNGETLPLEEYEVTPFDTATPGTKVVTVSAGEYTDTFTVTVNAHEYTFQYDDNRHWQKCSVCDSITLKYYHQFENACGSCTVCGFSMSSGHQYDSPCDAECNVCGTKREVGHSYNHYHNDRNHFEACAYCGDVINSFPHVYDNACDATCDCGYTRIVTEHVFDHGCDSECNVCGQTRPVPDHQYDSPCDPDCNSCGITRETAHLYREYVYNNDATTQKDGTKTRSCEHCGHKQTVTAKGTKLQRQNPFLDVKKSDFYYEAVLWAVEKGITSGTSATAFSPNNPCTRGQIATFLWRAAGQPAPSTSKNPFTDVKKSDYYYQAVLWAVGKGVTSGTSKTTFSPASPCTRGQIAAFLWRAAGQPAPSTSKNPFTDVKKSDYYYKAVLWAVGKGVTSGTSKTTFSPASPCTRGQIVTFLYRNYN